MDYEDRYKNENLSASLTLEQCQYLKTVVNYKYTFSPQLAEQLEALDLIISHGRLLIPTARGREVSKLR